MQGKSETKIKRINVNINLRLILAAGKKTRCVIALALASFLDASYLPTTAKTCLLLLGKFNY